jgi:hypothetical protein
MLYNRTELNRTYLNRTQRPFHPVQLTKFFQNTVNLQFSQNEPDRTSNLSGSAQSRIKVKSKSNQSSAPKTQRRQFFAQKIGVNAGFTAISGIFVLRHKEIDPKTCVAAIR